VTNAMPEKSRTYRYASHHPILTSGAGRTTTDHRWPRSEVVRWQSWHDAAGKTWAFQQADAVK